MRIGINGYLAARGVGGIARHSLVLLEALLRYAPEHEYVVFSDRPLPADLRSDQRIVNRVFRLPPFTAWEQFGIPLLATGSRLDVFFGPAYGLPLLLLGTPTVLMIHDLGFQLVPETHLQKARGYYDIFLRPSLRRARRVITPSQSTARDTSALLRVPRERIDVIYNAISPRFRPVADPTTLASVRSRYDLPERFILYLGTIEARKNLVRLIAAYARARAVHGITEPLILAGSLGWLYEDVLNLPAKLGLENDVRRLGFVEDADLPALLSAAHLFVYPSLYEGFGLPPIEAMACGTPVVASSAPSLPEVLGDAALLADPRDVDALADALARGVTDAPLRSRLREAGFAQSARYTSEALANQTLASFERAVKGR